MGGDQSLEITLHLHTQSAEIMEVRNHLGETLGSWSGAEVKCRRQSASLELGGLIASSLSSPLLSLEKESPPPKRNLNRQCKSALTAQSVARSTFGWFRGLQKHSRSASNILSPANVWMPPDQIHHKLVHDWNPLHKSSSYLLSPRCARPFSSQLWLIKELVVGWKQRCAWLYIHHLRDSPPLCVN